MIVTDIIMKLNIGQGLYIRFKAIPQIQEKFQVFRGEWRGGGKGGPVTIYNPRPTTMDHNYILRIYLRNYSIITPTL